MLVILILGIGFIGGIFLWIWGKKNYNVAEPLGAIFGIILGLFLLSSIIFIQTSSKTKLTIMKYEELKRGVNQGAKLDSEIYEFNTLIDNNKVYCDSWWYGWFHSKEVGNLEKLNYIHEED